MSLQKEGLTLTSLCLQNIAENMQSVWLKDYTEKNMEDYNFLYVEGPFNQLAGTLVQELIRILGESHKLSKGCLQLLLHPHLTELSLSSCSNLVNVAMMRLVTLRCKHLTSLDLHSCNKVPPASLAALVEGLPRLTKLCLADTQCDPLVLSSISHCCPRLCELDLSRCKKITPTSLMSLVYNGQSSSYRCQALRVLHLEEVKSNGDPEHWAQALCFILLALPCLEELSNHFAPNALRLLCHRSLCAEQKLYYHGFPSLAEVALVRVQRESQTNGPANGDCISQSLPNLDYGRSPEKSLERVTLRLKKLEDLDEEYVPYLGLMCPALEEVAIKLNSHSISAYSLLQWTNLSQLSLFCPELPNRTLEELLTTLHVVGSRLRTLALCNLLWRQQDSLISLLTLCPNLQTFQSHLTMICDGPPLIAALELPPWPGDPLPLPHLRTFSLLLEEEGSARITFQHALGGTLVSVLKGCPQLETLSLRGVTAVLDYVFEAVYASHQPLQRLSNVTLCSSNITHRGVAFLLRPKSALRSLDLSYCRDVSCREFQHLQDMARRERLNVAIVWQ